MSETAINEEILAFFKTLVNAERLRMAGLLGVEALSLVQLAHRLHIPLASASNHLGMLVMLGLVQNQDGVYSLDRKALEALARRTLAGSRGAPKVDEFEGDDFDRKVIHDFSLPNGQLKALPLQEKKFLSVLRYVARVFEPGIDYPEKQVNELLKRFHADTASLRRGLVDQHFLARSAGVYRRVEMPH